MRSRTRFGLVLGALAVSLLQSPIFAVDTAPAPAAAPPAHVTLTAAEVQWGGGPPFLPAGAKFAVLQGDPGKSGEPFVIRLSMPAGYKIPPHWHPLDEMVTVVSGRFGMGFGDKLDKAAGKLMGPGGFSITPKEHHHYAWAATAAVVQVQGMGPLEITYVNATDDPRNAPAKPAVKP